MSGVDREGGGVQATSSSLCDRDKQRERQRQEKLARQKTEDSKMAAAGEVCCCL